MSDGRAAPYPPDTRAKGWRFELDYEQIEQSSTWALAGPEGQAWALKLWLTAWRQVPCGSMPGDEEVIAASLGMLPKQWARHRKALLRGWWQADDGRLYHDTITARVTEMLSKRRKESDRKALARMRKAGSVPQDSLDVPPRSHGTGAGLHPESDTDHRPPTTEEEDYGAKAPASSGRASPTDAGEVCLALKAAGIGSVTPHSQRLQALVAAGASPPEFVAFAAKALEAAPANAFAYVLGCVEGERERAQRTTGRIRHGPLPNRQEAHESRNRAVADEWLATQGAAT